MSATDDYVKQARSEAASAAEATIQARAAELARADVEKARLAALAIANDLPETATPRQISDAVLDREAKHRAAVRARHGSWANPEEYAIGSVSNP